MRYIKITMFILVTSVLCLITSFNVSAETNDYFNGYEVYEAFKNGNHNVLNTIQYDTPFFKMFILKTTQNSQYNCNQAEIIVSDKSGSSGYVNYLDGMSNSAYTPSGKNIVGYVIFYDTDNYTEPTIIQAPVDGVLGHINQTEFEWKYIKVFICSPTGGFNSIDDINDYFLGASFDDLFDTTSFIFDKQPDNYIYNSSITNNFYQDGNLIFSVDSDTPYINGPPVNNLNHIVIDELKNSEIYNDIKIECEEIYNDFYYHFIIRSVVQISNLSNITTSNTNGNKIFTITLEDKNGRIYEFDNNDLSGEFVWNGYTNQNNWYITYNFKFLLDDDIIPDEIVKFTINARSRYYLQGQFDDFICLPLNSYLGVKSLENHMYTEFNITKNNLIQKEQNFTSSITEKQEIQNNSKIDIDNTSASIDSNIDSIAPKEDIAEYTNIFKSLLDNQLIVNMMLIAVTFAFISLVLFGKKA